jgi:predicted RNase H-like nuclease
MSSERTAVGVEVHETFAEVDRAHGDADRVLVDVPVGLPEGERRRCDEAARDRLGCRGVSVFYPPCPSAAEADDYRAATEAQDDRIGHGLSRQAYGIAPKMLEVDAVVDEYEGVVRESHPELCFAALNGQPVAYSKSSERGRDLRLHLLAGAIDDAEARYREVREDRPLAEVRRDDVLDSMVLVAQHETAP